MPRTWNRQNNIRPADAYDDTLVAGSTLESGSASLQDDQNAQISQLARILHGAVGVGNDWFSDVPGRGLLDIHTDLTTVEERIIVCNATVLTDITVPASQNWVILSVAGSEAPSENAAVAATTEGAIVAQSALSGAGFDVHELIEVAGPTTINPLNLLIVRDASTKQQLQSNGRDIFGLLQYESTGVDGAAFNDTSSGNRVKISFVRIDSGGGDLEAVPVADIENAVIEYNYNFNRQFQNIDRNCLISTRGFVDQAASVDVTRQAAYDNQGSTPVELTSNATLDVGAGLSWAIRDAADQSLFSVAEDSGGGATTVTLGGDIDVYNNNAVDLNFNSGVSTNLGGTRPIDIGVTDGVIQTTAGDLEIEAAAEILFDDGNRGASTFSVPLKLSEDSGEWDSYETAFGEVSILNAIVQAGESNRGTKVYAVCTSTTGPNNDIGGVGGGTNLDAQLPDFSTGDFLTDYDLFVNGELLRPGADAAANHDYYPGTSPADGQIRFENITLNAAPGDPDVICVIPYA